MKAILLFCAVALAVVSAQPAFPGFPQQFQMEMEVVVSSRQFTINVFEAIEANREFIAFDYEGSASEETWLFLDRDPPKHVRLINGTSCQVDIPPAGTHLRNIFDDLDGPGWTYVGNGTARGIACNVWTAQRHAPGGRFGERFFNVDVYFAIDSWRWFEANTFSNRPVMAHAYNASVNYDVTYNFEELHNKILDENIFRVPARDYCGGLHSYRPIPALPDSFVSTVEINILNDNFQMTMREYYDFPNQRRHVVEHRTDLWAGQWYDYKTRKAASVHRRLNAPTTCNVSDITADSRHIGVDGYLKSASDYWQELKFINFSYDGHDMSRNLPVQVWFGYAETSDIRGLTTWTFLNESFRPQAPSQYRTPIRMHIKGERYVHGSWFPVEMNYEFIDFVAGNDLFNNLATANVWEFPREAYCPGFFQPQAPIPALPESFSAVIEVDIPHDKTGHVLREWYDTPNQIVRTSRHFMDREETSISFYNLKKEARIFRHRDGRRPWCEVHTIDPNRDDRARADGSLKPAYETWQGIGDGAEYSYMGQQVSRRIPTNVWYAQDEDDDFKGLIEWGFALNTTWRFRGERDPAVPMRLLIEGSGKDRNGTWRPVTYVYQWTDFQHGNGWDPRVMHIPDDVLCHGLFGDYPLPKLPSDFQTIVEINDRTRNVGMVMREFYDYANNQVRIDQSTENFEFIQVWYYNKMKSLQIFRDLRVPNSKFNCSVHKIVSDRDPRLGPNGHIVDSSSLLMQFGNANFSFQGYQLARDIPTRVWMAHENSTWFHGRIEWHFANLTWNTRGRGQHEIPVQMNMVGLRRSWRPPHGWEEVDLVYEFVDFIGERLDRYPRIFAGDTDRYDCPPIEEPKALPDLPDDWMVTMEINLVGPGAYGETYLLKEYYDFDDNRFRIDRWTAQGVEVNVYLLNQDILFTSNVSGCFPQKLSASNTRYVPMDPSTHHLFHWAQLFNDTFGFKYDGNATARGIPVERWEEIGSGSFQGGNFYYIDRFDFADQGWVTRGAAQNIRLPVQRTLHGSVNGMDFARTYTYVESIFGPHDPAFYDIPNGCPGANPPPPPGPVKYEAGAVGAIAFGTAVLGIAVGALAFWLIQKRRNLPPTAERHSRMTDDVPMSTSN